MRISPPAAQLTAATSMCWLLLRYLRRRGHDVSALLGRNGFALDTLLSPTSRMRLHDLRRIWRLAALQLGNDHALGVRVASLVEPLAPRSWPMPFSLLEQIALASATLRHGAERQQHYLRLMCDGLSISIEEYRAGMCLVRWEFDTHPEEEPRHLVEWHLALAVQQSRRTLADLRVRPDEVWFTHAPAGDAAPYIGLFGTVPRFNAECNALVLHDSLLGRALPTSDPGLLHVLEAQAGILVQQLPSLEDFLARVREHIRSELPHGDTTASAVADTFDISARTLHRRLHGLNTSYQEQLDQVRYRLAASYLASRRYSMGEVASLVGFSQQGTFQRAFKLWAGLTPAEYQQQGLAAASSGSREGANHRGLGGPSTQRQGSDKTSCVKS